MTYNNNRTIEENLQFKEQIKNMFLRLNEMSIACIMLSEHVTKKLQGTNFETFEDIVIQEIKDLETKLSKMFSKLYDSIIDKCDRLPYFPLIFDEKKSFRSEFKLLKNQYRKLRECEYDNFFNLNKIFLARLEDFISLVKPDSNFTIPKGLNIEEVKQNYYIEEQIEEKNWENNGDGEEESNTIKEEDSNHNDDESENKNDLTPKVFIKN